LGAFQNSGGVVTFQFTLSAAVLSALDADRVAA
jgi:hypothetical protein